MLNTQSDILSVSPPALNDFRLLRLILIDSLSAGRVVELPLEGGAVLTGRNGRGKTSLLQLLPLFYGESPNRIVTKEAGRDSFIGYYLPRTTSYLLFEYQRSAGQKRLVVIYADRSEEHLRYRFVRHGFELNQFITVSHEIVQSPNLVKHLKMSNYQCSDIQIDSLAEYRAIIQGVASNTRDRERQKQLRSLTMDYACTSTNQPLGQIEKIVSGMFKRKTNFEDLQSMVVDCIAEQENSVSLSGDRRKIEDWPRHYRAYSEVMALAPTMELADQADQQWQGTEQVLGEIRAQYQSLQSHFDEDYRDTDTSLRSLKTQADLAFYTYNTERSNLSQQQLTARKEAEFIEDKARQLQQQHDDYARDNMAQKAELVAREAQFREELTALEKRKSALLGEQADISNRYAQLKQSEQEVFNALRDGLQTRRTAISAVCEANLGTLEVTFLQTEKSIAAQNEPARRTVQQAVDLANTGYGRCEYVAQNALPDPVISARWQAKRDQLEQVHKEKDGHIQQQNALHEAYRKAKQGYDAQECCVNEARIAVEHALEFLANTQRFHAPETGTLLHFLRHEHPDWMLDIAKVIRHDIFDRKDLSPSVFESNAALYGLQLNLDKLDTHPLADQHAALREIELAETRLQAAQSKLNVEEDKLLKLDGERKTADAAKSAQSLLVQHIQNRLQQIVAEVEEAKRQVDGSKREVQVQAKQALEAAALHLKTQQQALQHFDSEIKISAAHRQSSYQATRQTSLAQRDTQLHGLSIQQDEARRNLDVKLREYDIECNAALQHKGVDTAQLGRIDGAMIALNKTLATIRQERDAVSRWKNWCENDWIHHGQYLETAVLQREVEQQHKVAILQLDSDWKIREQTFKSENARLSKLLNSIEIQQKLVQQRIQNLQHYPVYPTPMYDATWTMDALTLRTNVLLDQAKQLEKTIREYVITLQRGFNSHLNTPPEQFLQSHLRDLPISPDRAWLPLFRRWFVEEHSQYQRILLTEAKTIAGSILSFHRDMANFNRKVLQFNRELQDKLDTSMLFESISQVSVEVISTIKELKYWEAICEIAEANRTWLDGLSHELPPIEFAQTLGKLLEHWDVKAGIRADLKHLIQIRGEVTENTHRRVFRKAADLEAVSSNGLSYLVLVIIFVAFINRIRRNAPVNIVWALDELKDLDSGNVPALLELLRRNNITLVSAFPDPDPETLALFQHRFTVEADRRLAEVRIDLTGELEHV